VTENRLREKRWRKTLKRRQVRAARMRQKSEHYGGIKLRQAQPVPKPVVAKAPVQSKAKRGLVSMVKRFFKAKV